MVIININIHSSSVECVLLFAYSNRDMYQYLWLKEQWSIKMLVNERKPNSAIFSWTVDEGCLSVIREMLCYFQLPSSQYVRSGSLQPHVASTTTATLSPRSASQLVGLTQCDPPKIISHGHVPRGNVQNIQLLIRLCLVEDQLRQHFLPEIVAQLSRK